MEREPWHDLAALIDENDRLKGQLRSAREALHMTDSERCRRLQAENDRLQFLPRTDKAMFDECRKEVERLRAELDRAREDLAVAREREGGR